MSKKIIFKKIISIFLVLILNGSVFAAIIQDNDGSAFVTKLEFDTLKHSFSQQVFDYNASIDGKIDGAIAEYIAGISYAPIETKKILYPCDSDETIWCMAPTHGRDACSEVIRVPKYHYYGLIVQLSQGGADYSNYNYSQNHFECDTTDGDSRIILTSSDNFVNDFVWDRWAEEVKTTLNCFAYTNTWDVGFWGSAFTVTIYDGVPNLAGSGYYSDFNTITDFVRFGWDLQNGPDRSNYRARNVIKGDVVCANDVTLTAGKTVYKNAIVYQTGTERYVCMDDPHWVNTNCTYALPQSAFAEDYVTHTHTDYFSQSGTRKYTIGTPTYEYTLTGKLPVFGMYSSKIDMATVKNKNNVISYNNGTETLTDIRLINGVPLIYEKKGVCVEWTPIMEDTIRNYNFYFSMSKFTGVPDPSTCIDVSVDGGTPTKSPVVKSGQKISFTMPSDGVVWIKWSDSVSGEGGGELMIGSCAEYTRIDRS